MDIRVEFSDGKAEIYTPYNVEFVKRIKSIGGAKWNSLKSCWTVPEDFIDTARKIIFDVYGYNDVDAGKKKTVILTCTEEWADALECVVLGKVVARAFHRDSGAKTGEDVALISGEIGSGGSRNNPNAWVEEGTKFKLINVSSTLIDRFAEERASNFFEITEVEEQHEKRKVLLKEKESLLKRLEEIEKLLSECAD